MALRAQRDRGPGVAARGPGDPPRGRRRGLPPGDLAGRAHGRLGLRLGLLAVVGRGRPLLRAGRGHRPVQDLLGRRAADRVGRPGRARRAGRLGLPALARLGLRGRLLHRVRVGHGARRLRSVHRRGQPGVALRAQRDRGPGVAASQKPIGHSSI